MAARLPQLSRLVQDDHSGTYKNNNQARFTALTIIGNGLCGVRLLKGGDCRFGTRDDN